MGFLSLTFRDLQYLVALAEKRHFGQAARACFVSQPALSSQIKKIEGYFGKTFFERKNKQLFLTQEGSIIVQKAQEILQNAKAFDTFLTTTREIFATPLTIGLIHTISPYYPNSFLETFLRKYPQGKLILREGFTQELVADLKNGKIDAIIISELFQDEKLDCFPLFKEPLLILANKKHPFAKDDLVSVNDLDTEDMIFLKEGNCLRNESIDLCPKNRRGNIHEYHLNSLEALKFMVALKPSYAIIPEMASHLTEELKKFVAVKKIKEADAYRQVSLFSRKNSPREKDILNFKTLLKHLP